MSAWQAAIPQFQPRDPDFRTKVDASFARQRAMTTLGIILNKIRPGMVEFEMPFAEELTEQHGFIHAGIITTALYSACGYVAFSLMEPDAEVLTVEFKTNLTAPARGQHFAFQAQVVKPGRTLTLCEARAFGVPGGDEKLVATMTGTLMAVHDRERVRR